MTLAFREDDDYYNGDNGRGILEYCFVSLLQCCSHLDLFFSLLQYFSYFHSFFTFLDYFSHFQTLLTCSC